MLRRRYLLSILNTETYRNYYYEYLYHNIVPSELVGFNLWDEELEVGSIDSSTGQNINSSTISRSKNYTRVIPSSNVYVHIGSANIYQGCYVYFYDINKNYIGVKYSANYSTYSRIIVIPSNCCYIRFRLDDFYGTTYNHDICINISNPKFNGVYLPYDPKEVRNQGKTKLVKIEGNGEIENQLAKELNATNWGEWSYSTTLSFNNGVATFKPASGSQYGDLAQTISIPYGHKIIYTFKAKATSTIPSSFIVLIRGEGENQTISFANSLTTSFKYFVSDIITTNGAKNKMEFLDNDEVSVTEVNLIDLTQEFPFDTPTSLTDYRVQNIIVKGTRPYNTGSYNSTTIQDIETKGFNLFNGIWVDGYINSSTGDISSSTGYKTTDFIKVIPNETYYCKANLISSDTPNVGYYDKDKKFIEFKGSLGHFFNNTFSFPNGVEYIRVTITNQYVTTDNFCINRSSNLNGTYKPFKNFIDLANFNTLDINGIHNEFKALDSGYVLRKKLGVVDLGTLTWTQGTSSGGLTYYETQLPSNAKTGVLGIIPNIATEKYALAEGNQYSNAQYGTFAYSQLYITIYTQTSPTGICYFELATYETVNIPLNHLGMVKLKDLNWDYNGTRFISVDLVNLVKKPASDSQIANAFIGKYALNSTSAYTDKQFAISSGGALTIKDSTYQTVSSFVSSFTDSDYLYYETVDVIDETGIVLEHNKIALPQPLKLDGVGSIHNTFEITKENYVFTRNVFDVDLGMVDWNKDSNNKVSFSLSNLKNVANDVTVNALCDSYIAKPYNELYSSSSNLEFGCANNTQALSFYKQNGYANVSTRAEIQTLFSGISLHYQLATPQVINIPRKHLGAIDLGSVNGWTKYDEQGHYYCNISSAKVGASSFCLMFKTVNGSISINNMEGGFNSNQNYYYICVSAWAGQTKEQVKQNLNGVYLFFETENEVTDFIDEALFQKGGEVNGVWFSWVENQLVQNGNFAVMSNWTNASTTYSVSNNVATITKSVAQSYPRLQQAIERVSGHKYLFVITAKINVGTANELAVDQYLDGDSGSTQMIMLNKVLTSSWQTFSKIYTASSTSTTSKINIYPDNRANETSGNATDIKNVILVDLTKGFGAGNEPTDVNDSRIQFIIENGYIPTNTSGTYKSITCEVLPNVEMKFQCK